MYLIRRWWGRHGLRIGLVFLALTTAWTVRQTQGAVVLEIYQWISRPFQGNPMPDEVLADARLQELQSRLVELESQNRRLQELLGYVSSNTEAGIAAPVIGRSADHWWQQITVGRGSQDGIEPGSVVLGTGGIVGRVIQVTPNTSRVLLISDPSSQVGVTVARSRSMGYLRGQSENRAIMEFFDKVPDVRPGDVITTSSFSQLFPAGLPVGRIESINLNKSPAPEAVIELTAPISYLEWVIIAPNSKSPEVVPTPLPSSSPGAAPVPTP
ncbi:rod shape-determining protein MreC [Oscillatoria sp. FACHB-1407]|uniref:rod shape-determining protein MreC n=1 Tax=Oscillatoria sp. FACHB-1407 TaxID=2692847 RepID=UPI0016828D17|nr:rod shape-determining protein MreC [Oscillatoria sp. FACHB-1407]MBD2461645.1 rod shape-determining protein MreC [Oscillatoria sp. FACHB-1407]